jgi:hypothetical protein
MINENSREKTKRKIKVIGGNKKHNEKNRNTSPIPIL